MLNPPDGFNGYWTGTGLVCSLYAILPICSLAALAFIKVGRHFCDLQKHYVL